MAALPKIVTVQCYLTRAEVKVGLCTIMAAQGGCCEARLRKEKQFKRKVAINAELSDLKQELEGLIR